MNTKDVASEHPNVKLVRSLFAKGDGIECYTNDKWDQHTADGIIYCGHNIFGDLQFCIGKKSLFAMAAEAAHLTDPGPGGEELLDVVAFGEDMVVVYARTNVIIKSNGRAGAVEWVMTVRIKDGKMTRGVDMMAGSGEEFYKEALNVPASAGITKFLTFADNRYE